MIENGTLLQDRYLIEKKIGSGGMGAVYLAVDRRFDNHVAIKETFYKEDEFADAFEREARLLNGLQHQVLPHVTDYFAENDGYFLVMQYIEGEDLSDILKHEGGFSVADVLRWTDNLLDALDYLHSQEPPVIHRDIKPHNLKLTPRGGIMLLDFGLAKVNQKDATEISVFGYSRTYSPLEQIQGTGTDVRSDIFALGATVFHLLTGAPPINALMRASAIVNGNPDPLRLANKIRSEISDAVANVINSAMALNPENRFISAKAMRQALGFAAAEESNSIVKASAPVLLGASAKVFDSAQNNEFPALDSFASTKNSFEDEKPGSAENTRDEPPINSEKIHRPANASSAPMIVDIPTKVSGRNKVNQTRILWAAAAVLLFFGIVTAFYLGSGENSGDQTDQPVVNANSSNTDSNRESAETLPNTTASDKPAEKSKADDTKNETVVAKAPESSEEPAQNAPVKRKTRTSGNDEDVLEEDESLEPEDEPEIVDAERENRRNQRRQRRAERPIPDEMTEEEFEQIKREERQNRRQRRNRPNPEYNEPE